ncbi:ATP-binding protein, partial [Actinomadura verrucosospora]|uniref:ATP-binding protein n=1 Tax=Actinomadura verrucosospora TaxID=46165 RepID=UPI0031ECC175
APPIPAELEVLFTRMRFPYARKAAPDVLATARAQRWDPAEVVRVLLAEEVAGRDNATRRIRRKSAGMPNGKTFGSWKSELSSIPQATQNALRTQEWVSRRENCVISGPSGTGKSHFMEALCHQAIDADLRVSWFTLETLAVTIGRAHVDGSIARTIAKICRSDIIVIDDIGLLPVGHETGKGLLYDVLDVPRDMDLEAHRAAPASASVTVFCRPCQEPMNFSTPSPASTWVTTAKST